jgi:hypothetical protein
LTPTTLSAFAFQSWSEQKVINAGLVISLVRMLVGGAGNGRAGNQKALLASGLARCLTELALASNAPAILKSQSLNALADILRGSAPNQEALTSLILTPLIPPIQPSSVDHYPADADDSRSMDGSRPSDDYDRDNGGPDRREPRPSETKWRRGVSVPAVVATVNLAVNGDGTPGREGLRVRAAAANLFEVSNQGPTSSAPGYFGADPRVVSQSYVAGSTELQLGILSTMSAPQPEDNPNSDLPSKLWT